MTPGAPVSVELRSDCERLEMSAKIFTVLSISTSFVAFALNDLGPLEKVRKDHPTIFVAGNVIEYTIGNEIGYVYNGEAEKCFEGELAESDAELFQEASLDAKKNLYNFLTKDDKSLEVQMGEARKLYEFTEAKMRRVVMFVGKDKVSVTAKPKSNLEVQDAVDDPAVAKVPAVERNNDSQGRTVATSIVNDAVSTSLTKSPMDCISMSKAAKLYARGNDIASAKTMYSRIVKQIVANERMDKEFAAGLLLEAAKFETANGDIDCALKYYRLIIRCDGMRRWHLSEQVNEANKNISQLMLKTF